VGFDFKPVDVIDGVVEDTNSTSHFFARLKFRHSGEESIVRIRYDQIPSRSHSKIVTGAIFIWFIGILRTDTDSTVIDVIQFDAAVWTEKEISDIEERAKEFSSFFEED